MRVTPTALPEVLIVKSAVLSDDRGFFMELFHATKFAALGLPTSFEQDNHSRSGKDTLRGLHYQLHSPQGKLIRTAAGRIFDVAVDVRHSSSNFGKWVGVVLEGGDGQQLWIPPGFAHGFLVLSETADVSYKCTTVYDAPSDRVIAWNDAEIAIDWPLPVGVLPRLSAKDSAAPTLALAQIFA